VNDCTRKFHPPQRKQAQVLRVFVFVLLSYLLQLAATSLKALLPSLFPPKSRFDVFAISMSDQDSPLTTPRSRSGTLESNPLPCPFLPPANDTYSRIPIEHVLKGIVHTTLGLPDVDIAPYVNVLKENLFVLPSTKECDPWGQCKTNVSNCFTPAG
jgi:hypothetical protein